MGKNDTDEAFLKLLIFSDVGMLHWSSLAKKHNCRLWGSQPSRQNHRTSKGYIVSARRRVVSFYIFRWKLQSQVIDTWASRNSMLPHNCQMTQGLHQDDTRSHYGYSYIVRQFLKECFPNKVVPWHDFQDHQTQRTFA